MPVRNAALAVLLFWSLLHGIRYILNRTPRGVLPWNLNKTRHFSSSTLSLHHVHLQVQTTACNTLHDRLIHFLTLKENRKYKIWLSSFYRIGYRLAVLGMVGAMIMLFWTCWQLLRKILSRNSFTVTTHLNKRHNTGGNLQLHDWPTITPLIPGITVPSSDLPIIICAVFVSQIIHELGHAIAAATENVSIQSIGASFTLVIPSASVSFTSSTFDRLIPHSRSVIVSAGPFHNLVFWLVLALVARINLAQYFWQFAYQDITDKGRIIINVSHNSALDEYLYPGSLITHINDSPLNSISVADDLWGIISRDSQADDVAGWCVDQVALTKSQSCCFREMSEANPLSCFRTMEESASIYGCVDPLPLLTSNSSVRCTSNSSCSPSFICTWPGEREQLWRLIVLRPENEKSIILWSGSLEEVQRTVMLDTLKPRLLIFPLSLPWLVARYSRYISLATLSLFFFNLLPIYWLDGYHLLKTVLVPGEYDHSNIYDMEAQADADRHPRLQSRAGQLLLAWLPKVTLSVMALSLVLTLISIH